MSGWNRALSLKMEARRERRTQVSIKGVKRVENKGRETKG
jgi:hypothetical protein